MTNIVVLIRDRQRLTYQTLRTLAQTTRATEFNLVAIDDESIDPVEHQGWIKNLFPTNGTVLRISNSKHITGQARNLGVYWSEKYFGRGDWLVLLDNDIALKPGWLSTMQTALLNVNARGIPFKVLGGYRHPYHGRNMLWTDPECCDIEEVDSVAGYSQLMTWETWDKYGPLDSNAPGVCQGEDYSFCRKIVEDGGKVGYVNPSVLYHCGLTNSMGEPATGWETFQRAAGVIFE